MTVPDRHGFKAEVEAAVLAELQRVGPDAFSKAALVRRFEGQGASRATLYRYVEAPLKSGMAGQHLARQVKAAAVARAARPEPPPATVQRDAATKLPAVVSVEEVASSGGVIALTERLVGCIQIAEQLIAHARTEDGGVRSPKQLLAASEHRECPEIGGVTPPAPMTGVGRELARTGGRSRDRARRCRRRSGPGAAGRRRAGTSASAATWPCAG